MCCELDSMSELSGFVYITWYYTWKVTRMAAKLSDKWYCLPVEIIGFIHKLAINVSLEMCQKLYNPEALEITGVERIILPKKSEVPSRLLSIARNASTVWYCQESLKIGQPRTKISTCFVLVTIFFYKWLILVHPWVFYEEITRAMHSKLTKKSLRYRKSHFHSGNFQDID